MTKKFILWACGIIVVTFLAITSYGVLFGNYGWNDYQTVWAGIVGTLLGYILKSLEVSDK